MSDDQNNVVDFVSIKSLMHQGYTSESATKIEDSWRKADPGYDKHVALSVNIRRSVEETPEISGISERHARHMKEIEKDVEAEHQEWLRQRRERRERREQDRDLHERSMRRIALDAEIVKKRTEELERELVRLAAPRPYISPSLDQRYIEAVVGKPDPASEWIVAALAVTFVGVICYLATRRR